MPTTKSDVLKADKILNVGLIQLYDDALGKYVRCAAFRDLIIETELFEKESLSTDDAYFGEVVTRQDGVASFNLVAVRSPWLLKNFFGFSQENISVGSTINVVDEEILVDDLAGDGIYAGLVNNIDWSNDTVQNIVVEDNASTVLTLGTDYTVEIINGYTAIQMVTGGAISKGDTIKVTYDYDPLVDILFSSGLANIQTSKNFQFIGGVESGVTTDQQDKVLEVTFPSADIISAVKFQFLDARGEKDEVEVPVQIRNRRGTQWYTRFIGR